ncbi:branched-chain amino acid transport system ATP-binding protein [Desulfacinum hydrothermale DSM 13146]|uniref:Branched-chain amino acid transport system ATP-binding protein n=1 Tax=Desulfacinum hydrothermale DSM 13146 TaxID=1121390 RepID=A0A1W1XRT3_9BACT|nr:ABC transporter ATP-binding protein [Desulfacinum hydrothermale]SMC26606.1 branched-chain amino acid transport system ATP-binding protein [Desulfacinum hydrothermale DSM 13146]
MTRPSLLDIRDLTVQLGGRPILQNIQLSVAQGEIVSLIGPNGAGKTTLLHVITGLVRPKSGSIHFGGKNITGWPPHRICRMGIACTFQIARPFPEMTAAENVQIGLWFGRRAKEIRRRSRPVGEEARRLLQLVGLEGKEETPGRELTLSEQRRLEVARALATGPRLLLLDEIAAGLSPQAVSHAAQLVRTLRDQGMTVLLIDHFLNLTARVSDRLVALDQGETIAEGPPAQVLHHPEVLSAYLGERPSKHAAGEDR